MSNQYPQATQRGIKAGVATRNALGTAFSAVYKHSVKAGTAALKGAAVVAQSVDGFVAGVVAGNSINK